MQPVIGKQVTVVNRVRDDKGQPVPYDAFIGGTVVVIRESERLPEGIARIIVHNSMYKIDPISFEGHYKIGVPEWGLPIDPITEAEAHPLELVERENLTPDRQFGYKRQDGKSYRPKRFGNTIRRHDPLALNIPGPRQDGAMPAGFGENQ
jgi:hypothetical protein